MQETPPVHGYSVGQKLGYRRAPFFHIFRGDEFLVKHVANEGGELLGMGIELPEIIVQAVGNAAGAVFLRAGRADGTVFQRLMNGSLCRLHGNVEVMRDIGKEGVPRQIDFILTAADFGYLPFLPFDGDEDIGHQHQDD